MHCVLCDEEMDWEEPVVADWVAIHTVFDHECPKTINVDSIYAKAILTLQRRVETITLSDNTLAHQVAEALLDLQKRVTRLEMRASNLEKEP
jgi:hypothetical protein